MEIMDGMLLRNKNEKLVRVVFSNRLSSIIYVIGIGEGKRFPYPMEKDATTLAVHKGEMEVITDDPTIRYVLEEELSSSEKIRREKAWKVVTHVLQQMENEQQIFLYKYRQKAMKNTMVVFQMQYNTVKRYLIEYWRAGREKNGLLPRYYKCGARGSEKKVGTEKRGRPRKYGSNKGVNITNEIKRKFTIGLNRHYYTGKQNTLKFAYEMTIRDFFTKEVVDVNNVKVPIIHEEIPTYHQFLYHYRKTNNLKHEITQRNGSRIYHQQYRSIVGNSTQDSGEGPGTLWQTDSTPLNVTCVSSLNRSILVGSPLLHLVCDVYSRVIVGFSLSFESLNSYSGAMTALLNSMTSKKIFCEKFGIDIEDKWEVACIPHRIFTDRGELNGKQIESAIEGLGISIQNSSSYRPDNKGIVEQALNQIQLQLASLVDGASLSGKRVRERGESDVRLRANLTIDELTTILIKCIVFHNNYHVLEGYVLSDEMVKEGVEKVPIRIWEFGLNHHKGILRTLSHQKVKFHLMPEFDASITSRGVKFKQMYYASEFSLKNNWFETARKNGNKRIKIKVDVRDMTEIYTITEEGELHTLKLVDQYEKYRRRSIEEVEQIIIFEKEMETKSKQKELQEKMKLFNDVEEIMNDVRKSAKLERGNISKSRRIKGIKENRKAEREIQREFLLGEKEAEEHDVLDDSVIVLNEEDGEDELALFRRLRN